MNDNLLRLMYDCKTILSAIEEKLCDGCISCYYNLVEA